MPAQFDVPPDVIERVCTGKLPPAAYSQYLDPLHNRHVIGVNNVYLIGVWIDAVFFGDGSWYLVHQARLAKWPGLKVSCAPRFNGSKRGRTDQVKFLSRDKDHRKGISPHPCRVSWNGNSGAAAISLAHHLGVKRVLLLGFDMNAPGPHTHWHGSHGKLHPTRPPRRGGRAVGHRGPPFQRHLQGFPAIAADAKQMKIEILNVNRDHTSAIDVFPQVALSEVLK